MHFTKTFDQIYSNSVYNKRKFEGILIKCQKPDSQNKKKKKMKIYLPANIKRLFKNMEKQLCTFKAREVHFLERFWRLSDKVM